MFVIIRCYQASEYILKSVVLSRMDVDENVSIFHEILIMLYNVTLEGIHLRGSLISYVRKVGNIGTENKH